MLSLLHSSHYAVAAMHLAPLLLAVAVAARDLDKCAGCAVVMRSLQKVLSLEHLDEDKTDILSGGRLDGNGNRQGKLVKYATSEFRTSHLLDQVCDYADTFIPRYEGGWAPNATKQQRFEDVVRGKAKPFPKLTKAHNEEETLRLKLRSYCDSIVEDHEDALAGLIVAEASSENALQAICRDATASCDDEGLASVDAHVAAEAATEKKRKKRKKSKKKKEL